MNIRLMHARYMEQASGEADGGAAAAAAAAAASAAAAGGKGEEKKGDEPSLLKQGSDAAAQAAAAQAATDAAAAAAASKLKADPLAWLPEKFRVKKDGTEELDLEASAKKGLGSLAELEKRMKDTGLPPATPAEYKFTPPRGMEKLELDAAETEKAKVGLHALGLTPKQFQGVMEMYVGNLNGIVERGVTMGATKATEELAKTWGKADSPQFKANLGLAFKAFNAFADEGDKAAIDSIGNHPAILRVLAKIGREMQEDTSVGDSILSKESLESLMKDPAYFDGNHARHAEVKGKVMKHFEAQAAAEARRAATG